MRSTILRQIYRLFPFNLKGDCQFEEGFSNIRISCVINFYGRLDLLRGILYSLAQQRYARDCFEVILVEDRGGTEEGKQVAASFVDRLNINYLPLITNFGRMGYSRNFGLAHTVGDIILFLDDDTVILQDDFLAELDLIFRQVSQADAVIPHGHASYAIIDSRYDYHDAYFMTSRCMAYRRGVLLELGGFMDHFVGQEDVEFVARFTMAGKISFTAANLNYFHPPLLVPTIRKPRAVGFSFFHLRKRYPALIWLLLLLNCARHAPLWLVPIRRYKEQGRFGVGFLLGIFDAIRGSKEQVYG